MHIRDMNSSGCFVASTEQRFASSLFIQDSFVFASPLAHKKNQKNNLPFKNFFHLFPPLWGPRVYDNPSPLCWFSGSSYRWLPAFFLFFCLVRLWVAGPRWHHLSRCLIVIRHTQSSWQELGRGEGCLIWRWPLTAWEQSDGSREGGSCHQETSLWGEMREREKGG